MRWSRRCCALVLSRRGKATSIAETQELNAEWERARPYSEVPGPPPLPLLGNNWRFLPIVGDYSIEEIDKVSTKLYYRYGPVVKLAGLLGRPDMLFLYDADEIERVFRNEELMPHRPSMPSLNYYKHVLRKDFFGENAGVIAVITSQRNNPRHTMVFPHRDVVECVCMCYTQRAESAFTTLFQKNSDKRKEELDSAYKIRSGAKEKYVYSERKDKIFCEKIFNKTHLKKEEETPNSSSQEDEDFYSQKIDETLEKIFKRHLKKKTPHQCRKMSPQLRYQMTSQLQILLHKNNNSNDNSSNINNNNNNNNNNNSQKKKLD